MICPEAVKGLLYSALAVSTGEAMQGFRTALYWEIFETLDIMEGCPSREAVAYRDACVEPFFQKLGMCIGCRGVNPPQWGLAQEELR